MIIDAVELKHRYQQRIAGARDKKVYIGPEILSLDINNTCNLSCQYCSAHHAPDNPHQHEKAHFFPWEKFLRIVGDSVEMKIDQVHLTGAGEPTLHPKFRDMMRHLEQQPLKTKLFTNATFPLEACLDVIKGDHVVIDLSAVDRQQYHALQGKDLFDRVITNIERLVSLRDAEKTGFAIEIVYIVNNVNINQKQEMQEMALRLGVNDLRFIEMNVNAYNQKIALPDGSIEGEKIRTPPSCFNGWFYMMVKSEDDQASMCCRIPNMRLGELDQWSLKELWQSSHMMNMRLLGKYGQIQKMYKACQTCPFYEENIQRSQDLAKAGV